MSCDYLVIKGVGFSEGECLPMSGEYSGTQHAEAGYFLSLVVEAAVKTPSGAAPVFPFVRQRTDSTENHEGSLASLRR